MEELCSPPDESGKESYRGPLKEAAPWYSRVFFLWVHPLLQKGAKRTLMQQDMPGLAERHQSTFLAARLRKFWELERATAQAKGIQRRPGMMLLRALIRVFAPSQPRNLALLVLASAVHITQALALGWLLSHFAGSTTGAAGALGGWGSAAVLVACGLVGPVFIHHFYISAWELGMEMRLAGTAAIYDKILRVRLGALAGVTTGHVINLATTDVERFILMGIFWPYLWEAPLETVVILYLGIRIVGVAFLAAMAALVVFILLQADFSHRFARLRAKLARITDERVKLTSQAVTGAHLVKMSAWEPALLREIGKARSAEVKVLRSAAELRAANESLFFVQPTVLALLVFGVHSAALGNELTPSNVFVTLALLNITQMTMGKFLYMAVQACSEGWISIGRIEAFLLMDENVPRKGGAAGGASSAPEGRDATLTASSGGAAAAPAKTIEQHATVANGDIKLGIDSPARAPDGEHGDFKDDGADGSARPSTFFRDAPAEEPSAASGAFLGGVRADDQSLRGNAASGGGGGGAAAGGSTPASPAPRPGSVSIKGESFAWGEAETGGAGPLLKSKSESARASAPTRTSMLKRLSRRSAGTSVADSIGQAASAAEAGPDDEDAFVASTKALGTPTVSLRNITLEVRPGELVAVVGAVGASKSSLLMAMLGELVPVEGRSTVVELGSSGEVAFAPQEPWIQNAPLRDNVLFGREMDQRKYEAVLDACELRRDLSMLPDGDMTLIGDRGVNLSGGQRARVGLARVAYADVPLYLLDDPLSAVDPKVGRHLFKHVVCGLLAGKTRVLVTHQLQHLKAPEVDSVVVMHNGTIVAQGKYADLAARGHLDGLEVDIAKEEVIDDDGIESPMPIEGPPVLGARLVDISESHEVLPAEGTERRADRLTSANVNDRLAASALNMEALSPERRLTEAEVAREAQRRVSRLSSKATDRPLAAGDGPDAPPGDDDGAEEREVGRVRPATYIAYARAAAGLPLAIALLLLLALGQGLVLGASLWLAQWSRAEDQQNRKWVLGLLGFTLAATLVSVVRAEATFAALVEASHVLHDRMLGRVLRAPASFFDSRPAGRILNRFAGDVCVVDDTLPMTVFDFVTCSLMVVGSVALAIAINPWVLLSLLPAGVGFRYMQQLYLSTSREVKRLEAAARSPVYSCLAETLDGLATVRAFGAQERFQKLFRAYQDENSKAYYAFLFTGRWLGLWLDMVVLVLLAATAFFSVAVDEFGSGINPGYLGAALAYVIQLGGLFQWAVRQSAEVENQIISVERILQYCEVEQEAPWFSPEGQGPPPEWPAHGELDVHNLWASYNPSQPPVLKGLSFRIPAGSTCGVVGRTGAGKSTLVSCFFRLVEYDRNKGYIEMDGIKTCDVGLHELRGKLSVIPQTPFLFSGTVRINLDPFSRFSDDMMWAALESVQMKAYVSGLPGGLSAPISESGSNLSVGQRQLLCLARAILQRSKLLLMDEATANIDTGTDSLIQAAVRTQFSGCTVITVAHRLRTIIDCDRVLVLSHGQVLEEGHPHELLLKGPEGAFAQMVDEASEEVAGELRRLAKEAFDARQSTATAKATAATAAPATLFDVDLK